MRTRHPSSWVWARIGRKAHASASAINALCGREFRTTLYPTDLPRCAACEAEVARLAGGLEV
jgi:hypothetical protein